MTSENFIDLPPLLSARGTITLPALKHFQSHPVAVGLAQGATETRDVLLSDDTEHYAGWIAQTWCRCGATGAACVPCAGLRRDFPVKQAELFLGNAGTAFRPLTRRWLCPAATTNCPALRVCTSGR